MDESTNKDASLGSSVYKPPTLNPDDFRDEIKDLKLTKAQEDEFLGAIFEILYQIVLNSWGVDSSSLIINKIFSEAVNDSDK